MLNYNEIIDRLINALNIKKDNELARIMSVTPAVVSTWRKRNTINHEKLYETAKINNLSID